VGVGVDRGRSQKLHAKPRDSSLTWRGGAGCGETWQRNEERGEESARLSCPLHTEAVPSKGFRAEFQRAQTRVGRAAKRSVSSLRAAGMTGCLRAFPLILRHGRNLCTVSLKENGANCSGSAKHREGKCSIAQKTRVRLLRHSYKISCKKQAKNLRLGRRTAFDDLLNI